ncbi:teichoic acid D-Ala incorporation-associated protein DltX|uniref:Teichoic acid D-Ala incorporation-associated protein DltX n=1 Tax=Leuconostoc lactis TaxID=1246 RepID=A0A6L7A721_LEULA|nr:teichoic acid D-Ala incorporation-associated protein DltX [Leuconostoc lactis]
MATPVDFTLTQPVTGDDNFYIIFTSGTTGKPKGVQADLKAASDRLAAHITNLGLTDKAPIMVYGGQQFEMVASFLGSVKSGHAYVPVDVNSADERLLDILAFYFCVILILVYLYSYSGVGQGHFIYNEF